MRKKIKVLIVDDSAVVRQILENGLSKDPNIEIVGKANNVFVARDKIVLKKPDVITLDVEMPRMDGIEFLKRLMPQYPLPVIMVSSMTSDNAQVTLDALDAGAVDFVLKPSMNISQGLNEMMKELIEKIKTASTVDVSQFKKTKEKRKPINANKAKNILVGSTDKIIAIGASTGGTVAITKILENYPANMPGTVIVQHMPAGFTKRFAGTLNQKLKIDVKEAEDGDRIISGRVLIAPGDFHMAVTRSGGQYIVKCKKGEKINGHCPSVDVLFSSVAKNVASNAIGILLTGMGKDGAYGLLDMKKSGSKTIIQDEKTSVVFGMPKEAYKLKAAEHLTPIDEIVDKALNYIKEIKNLN